MSVAVSCAVLAEIKPLRVGIGALLDEADTCVHIVVGTEVVGLTVDLSPGAHVETGAEAVAATLFIDHPGTRIHETRLLVEGIGHTVYGVVALGGLVIALEVEITVSIGLPAASQLAVHEVEGIAVHVDNAGTGNGLVTVSTNDGGDVDHVVVTVSRQGDTPIHDGCADVAPSSAGVASLGTSGLLILHSMGSMNVGGALLVAVGNIHVGGVGVDFGIDLELLVGESVQRVGVIAVHIRDNTLVDVNLQVVGPELVGLPEGLGGVAGDLHICVEGYDADRQLGQDSLTGLIVDTRTADGNGSGVVLFVDGVLSGKALSQHHVIQLPMVNTVQIDYGIHLLNGLDIGSDHIHPEHRAAQQTVQSRIGRHHVNGGGIHTRLDLNETDLHGLVAHHVADLELHAVVSVGHSQIGNLDLTVFIGALDLNAVHVSLSRLGVDPGVIVQGSLFARSGHALDALSHVGGYVQNVGGGGHDLALLHLQSGAACLVEVDLIEHGSLAVHDGVGIVNGKAIQIVGHGAVDGAVIHPQGVIDGLVEDDGDEEIASGAGGISGIHVPLIAQQDLLLPAEIHGQVMPAGLVHVVVDVLGGHHVDLGQGVVGTVTVGIVTVEALHPALNVILGDPEPEAESTGVLNDDLLRRNTQADVGVLLGMDGRGGKSVCLQTQGVVTVVHLAVLAGCQGQIVDEIAVGLVEISLHDGDPLIEAVLEVLQHHRILAQLEKDGGLDLGIERQSSGHRTRNVGRSGGLIHGHEVQTVEMTQSVIGDIEDDIVSAEGDLLEAVLNGRLDGDTGALAVRNGDYGLNESQLGGNRDLEGMLTDDIPAVKHLRRYGAQGTVGYEHTVLDDAHTVIGQSPGHVGRDLGLITDGIGANSVELNRGTGRIVVIIGAQGRTGKLTVSGSRRNNQNGVGGGTLAAVGQRAVDLEILTGALGHELGGAAAVAVCRDHATQLNHVVSHFVLIEAGRVGGLTAVADHDHKGTVALDAHEGAGLKAGGVVLASRIHVLTNTVAVGILDQEGKVHRNNLLFPTGDGILGGADGDTGHIVGSGLAVPLVSVDDDAAASAVGLTAAVDEHLAVQDHIAQRLSDQVRVRGVVCVVVPAQRAVGGGYDVTVAISLGISGVGRHRLDTVVTGSGNHLLVTGDDLSIGIVQINLQNVGHLTKGADFVVQDNLGFLNTGSQLPISL